MDDGFAAEIVDVIVSDDECSVCERPLYTVYMKFLAATSQEASHQVVSCINKECEESKKNFISLQ